MATDIRGMFFFVVLIFTAVQNIATVSFLWNVYKLQVGKRSIEADKVK